MNQLGTYISELLFKYDCVIIPNFGGIITNYSPATVHPTQHLFTAPSRSIAFNAQLKNNDGLLANYIAEKNQLSYSEALNLISSLIEDITGQLKKGKKVEITYVGSFFLDVEKNLQFVADSSINYLIDSFGLTDFRSNPVKRNSYAHAYADAPITAEIGAKSNLKKYLALAAGIPLAVALYWIPLKTNLLKEINFSYSSFNPFEGGESSVYKVVPNAYQLSENSFATEDVFVSTRVEVVPEIIEEAVVKETVSTSSAGAFDVNGKYQVIAGCFMSEENANKYVAQLNQKGFTAGISGKTKNGFFKVCYSAFNSKEEASKTLAEIQKQDPQAWLLSE